MADYEVGYGKPPQHTKWKPGQSGNPGGVDSETRNRINENARKAVKAQELFLDGLLAALENVTPEQREQLLRADHNKIIADAMDRALGKATQPTEVTNPDGSLAPTTVQIVAVKPDDDSDG